MFSALKRRWIGKQDDAKLSPFPSGVAAIGQEMQTKFSKGVQYNMKIVIRGERNTGKSCLLTRLQGKQFNEAYIPSQEIQAASINWKYRSGDNIVKVDVWDIVDKGQKKKQKQDTLKISNEPVKNENDGLALDAEFIDVYKGTHGVIMLLDITKPWTWKYIESELPRVPNHLPVLVMANFRDMGEHRLVAVDTMFAFIEHMERPLGSAEINFVESSLKNGFGLRYLYQFLNIPFLILQRETLLRQLEANALEIEETRELLLRDEEKEDQNYEKFILSLANRSVKTSGTVTPSSETDDSASDASPKQNAPSNEAPSPPSVPVTSLPPSHVRQSAVTATTNVATGRNYTARLEKNDAPKSLDDSGDKNVQRDAHDIHDFAPDADLDPSFLDGNEKRKRWWNRKETKKVKEPVVDAVSEDESDDEGGNPLVADYQDFDSDDETQEAVKSDIRATEQAHSSDPDSDVDDDLKQIDSESSDDENPLVTVPVDSDNSDEDVTAGTSLAQANTTPKAVEDSKTGINIAKEVRVSVDDRKKISPGDEVSSDDEDDGQTTYEVAGDFDLDDPSIDDWLGGRKEEKEAKNKDHAMDNTSPHLSETIESKTDKETPSLPSSDAKETGNSLASYMISADDLDLFVNEQMRKTSISQGSEESETKKPKKKKEKKPGDEEKRKKKKKASERVKADSEEQGDRKKKHKSKDGKRKKSSKKITEASNESSNYELL